MSGGAQGPPELYLNYGRCGKFFEAFLRKSFRTILKRKLHRRWRAIVSMNRTLPLRSNRFSLVCCCVFLLWLPMRTRLGGELLRSEKARPFAA
jgi:hypothetical protein